MRNGVFGILAFNRLNEVQVGDSIEIITVNDTYQYEVTEIKVLKNCMIFGEKVLKNCMIFEEKVLKFCMIWGDKILKKCK